MFTGIYIAASKEAANLFVSSQLGPLTRNDCTRAMLFTDGSLIPEEGVGAAALHVPTGRLYPATLGSHAEHTVYEAELVGIRLAAEAARLHLKPHQNSFWIFIDNQASIRALSKRFTTSPALALRLAARQALAALLDLSPCYSLTLVWCPAHVGIQENEQVDEAAKAATAEGVPQHLPTSLASVRQRINAASKATVTQAPSAEVVRRL